ncbi:MAG: NifU family protein [Bacteriovoracaceae bacterium]|nr:NifU family protein [Bacteriovoracaceae bacterium]
MNKTKKHFNNNNGEKMNIHNKTEVTIDVEPTPNPNALKFICSKDLISSGRLSFQSPAECASFALAYKLFDFRGVDQVHLFQNVLTISKFSFAKWDELSEDIIQYLRKELITFDAVDATQYDPKLERLAQLSPDLRKIEEILNAKIRPGLQGDGGDLEVDSYEQNVLMIKYQGACGTCPSSTQGTLEAIRGILRDEFNPEIEVFIAP